MAGLKLWKCGVYNTVTKKEFEDGFQERRTDMVSVRLALLEKCVEDSSKSQTAIHIRLSDIQKEFAFMLSKGLDAIVDKTDAQTKALTDKMDAQIAEYNKRANRITAIETALIWIERAGYFIGAWLAAVSTWVLRHEHVVKGGK